MRFTELQEQEKQQDLETSHLTNDEFQSKLGDLPWITIAIARVWTSTQFACLPDAMCSFSHLLYYLSLI